MRLTPAERDVLAQLRAGLTGRFGARLDRLMLFGSRARGAGHDESDLDVLVLVRGLVPAERREILDLAFELELSSGLRLSPLARSTSAWSFETPLGREIARDGVAA